MTINNTPFYMPSEPKNGLDLLCLAFFEPVLLAKFYRNLTSKQALLWVLRSYPWIILLSVLSWIGGMGLSVILDMPIMFPQAYDVEFLSTWQQTMTSLARLFILAAFTWDDLGIALIFGLGVGLSFGLVGFPRQGIDITISVIVSIGIGLSVGLGGSFGNDFSIGLIGALVGTFGGAVVGIVIGLLIFGITIPNGIIDNCRTGCLIGGIISTIGIVGGFSSGSLSVSLGVGLGVGLGISSLANSLETGELSSGSLIGGSFSGAFGVSLISGLICGFGFIAAFYIGYFRILFYPFHVLMGSGLLTFTRNPYYRDGVIWLPLWPADKKLLRLAKNDLEGAHGFINFLLEYRPLQKRLAARLTHAAAAGLWLQNAYELQVDGLSPPSIQKEHSRFLPSEQWLTMVAQVQEQLRASQQHTQIGLKTAAFEEFLKLLRTLREQTLRESRKWNQDYLEALDLWLTVANEYFRTLQQQAALLEPITTNIYRSGEALHPNMDANIFVGRDDLRETLAREILTARAMPMFLIQGQRRVGKTSLLNFLPVLLGPQFQVVLQDMQSELTASVLRWLTDLRQKVNKQFRIKEDAWNPPQDWLEAWGQIRAHLEQICEQQKCKLILAFDEYENFHRNFQEDPCQAEKLLGALRSFSQRQNQVVFLFAGVRFFSELQAPNWNEYFVQIKHLRVDYLKQADALKLIQHPVPEFNLVYPDDVAQRIFELTQGHPALVQQTCSELVNLANRSNHKHITHEDVDAVLHSVDNYILSYENPTISVFWSQFCSKTSPETAVHRTTLRQILTGQTPTDKISLFRLEQHGYIMKDGDTWKMQVPLFEMWLQKYANTFE